MKAFFSVGSIAVVVALIAVVGGNAQQFQTTPQEKLDMPGMIKSQNDKQKEADIATALAKLSPEDRRLAEAQKFCPVMTKNRLGGMGTPIKVMIKDKPVFLCCKGCQTKAMANPDKTLATVAALVKANAKP